MLKRIKHRLTIKILIVFLLLLVGHRKLSRVLNHNTLRKILKPSV